MIRFNKLITVTSALIWKEKQTVGNLSKTKYDRNNLQNVIHLC